MCCFASGHLFGRCLLGFMGILAPGLSAWGQGPMPSQYCKTSLDLGKVACKGGALIGDLMFAIAAEVPLPYDDNVDDDDACHVADSLP